MAGTSWLDVFADPVKEPGKNVEGAKVIGAAAEKGLNALSGTFGKAPPQVQQLATDNPIFAQNIPAQGPPAPPQPAPGAAPPPPAAQMAAPTPVAQQQTPPAMAEQRETMTQLAPKLSEQQKTAEESAYAERLKAEEAKAKLEQNAATAQSLIAQDTITKLQKQQQQDQADAESIKKDAEVATKRWETAIDEYHLARKAGPEKPSEGQSILAAIAQGLGAFGSSLTGQPNQAMAIINKAADARVRKWERDLDEAKGNIDARHNAVAWFRQKGLDARGAAAAARQSLLDDALVRGDALTAQYKSDTIKQGWEATKAGLLQERVATLNRRALEEQDKVVVKRTTAPAATGSLENQIRLEGLKVDVPQKDKDGNVTYKTYQARSATDAEKIRQALVVRQAIGDNLKLLKANVQDKWQSLPLSTAKKEADKLADDLRTQFGVLRGLGALSDKDYTIASQVGDPSSWLQTDNQTLELANSFDGRLNNMIESELHGRGLLR